MDGSTDTTAAAPRRGTHAPSVVAGLTLGMTIAGLAWLDLRVGWVEWAFDLVAHQFYEVPALARVRRPSQLPLARMHLAILGGLGRAADGVVDGDRGRRVVGDVGHLLLGGRVQVVVAAVDQQVAVGAGEQVAVAERLEDGLGMRVAGAGQECHAALHLVELAGGDEGEGVRVLGAGAEGDEKREQEEKACDHLLPSPLPWWEGPGEGAAGARKIPEASRNPSLARMWAPAAGPLPRPLPHGEGRRKARRHTLGQVTSTPRRTCRWRR